MKNADKTIQLFKSATDYQKGMITDILINKIKDGESKENVLNRFLPYYENDILYTLSENKFPLIVTHKHVARVLMKYLLKMSDENFENYEIIFVYLI